MIDTKNTIIDMDFQTSDYEEIYRNLQILYTTPVGTVPFDRGFGLDIDIVDSPINVVRGKLIVEYIEKTKKYEPRAIVQEVDFIESKEDGKLIPKVVIKIGD